VKLPVLEGVEHRRAPVNGIELHLAVAGDRDAPPLLLLHGWPQHWWSWRRMIGPLAERRRVLVPDLRGWGWSDAPPGDYAKSTFVADVVALLDAEGLERVDVIGHDWGGWTGFLLGLEHPDRVRRLVGLDIQPPWPGRRHPRQLGAVLLLSYQLPLALGVCRPELVRTVIRGGSAKAMRWSDDELNVYAEVLREPARARASSACYRTFLARELPAIATGRAHRADQLSVPALLIMGAESLLQRTLSPQPSRNLRVETVAGAGHFLPEETPSEVLSLAGPFLDG
jgi:pimeloyl-ACP methyl ester carboxylesterase